ncbi:MAG: methyltransferase domain-containing protein [bacterium]|nr:methyltransferase domain-containing protein [bacterium]
MESLIERMRFFKNALRDRKVGAVTMSSGYVVADVLKRLPEHPHLIVEYGPGEGAITRAILRILPADARLVAVEPNKEFLAALEKIADSRLTVIQKMAQDLSPEELAGMQGADAVVASLPSFYLSKKDRQKVVADAYDMLLSGGVFIFSHQYSWLMRKPLEEKFADVVIAFEPRNIFPCFILSATK